VRQRVKKLAGPGRGGAKDVRVLTKALNPCFVVAEAQGLQRQLLARPPIAPSAWGHQVRRRTTRERLPATFVWEIRQHGLSMGSCLQPASQRDGKHIGSKWR